MAEEVFFPGPWTRAMIALEQGGLWYHVDLHSIVLDGQRWDALNRTWRPYDHTPEEIEATQIEHSGRKLTLEPKGPDEAKAATSPPL